MFDYLQQHFKIYYFEDNLHREVDFVLKEKLKVRQLIQVCWDTGNYKTKEREIGSLFKASEKLKCKNLVVVTEDKESIERVKGRTIKYIPLWRFLLEKF